METMKKIMLIGRVGCGKTSLAQSLAGEYRQDKKTQTIEIQGNSIIDTPGEYLENKNYYKALVVAAVEVDCILLLQACNDLHFSFSPRMYSMFNRPMIGVLTKADLAPDAGQLEGLTELLRLAGAERVFCVSSLTGEGMEALRDSLLEPF